MRHCGWPLIPGQWMYSLSDGLNCIQINLSLHYAIKISKLKFSYFTLTLLLRFPLHNTFLGSLNILLKVVGSQSFL